MAGDKIPKTVSVMNNIADGNERMSTRVENCESFSNLISFLKSCNMINISY